MASWRSVSNIFPLRRINKGESDLLLKAEDHRCVFSLDVIKSMTSCEVLIPGLEKCFKDSSDTMSLFVRRIKVSELRLTFSGGLRTPTVIRGNIHFHSSH